MPDTDCRQRTHLKEADYALLGKLRGADSRSASAYTPATMCFRAGLSPDDLADFTDLAYGHLNPGRALSSCT